MGIRNFKWECIVIFVMLSLACSPQENTQDILFERSKTILQDYVNGPSPEFSYELVHTVSSETYDFLVLKMTSQNWLNPDQVEHTEWWHWVTIVVPKNNEYSTGMVWIGSGSTASKMPSKPNELILATALQTNSVVAEIHNIPFQPLSFVDDDQVNRTEDEIIAYGWRKFLEGGAKDEDAIWLARLPMTKAVKLGMDAVSEVLEKNYQKPLTHYVVAGASKRGWTTWTTAIADSRVVGIIPVVIDMLNLEESFLHHWRNYGFWAPAVNDYVDEGIMEWMGTEEFDRLLEITDPYSYREEITMPKLLINASGDQFFQPDSWKFYWDELEGEKHIQYVPNFGHDLSESDAIPNLISFYSSILNQTARPIYEWKVEEEKIKFHVNPANTPLSVKVWSLHNSESRDFRIDEFGPNWKSEELPIQENGKYEYHLASPEQGYTGYFLEVTFAGQSPLKVTSGVEVMPRTYPFEPYQPKKQELLEEY